MVSFFSLNLEITRLIWSYGKCITGCGLSIIKVLHKINQQQER